MSVNGSAPIYPPQLENRDNRFFNYTLHKVIVVYHADEIDDPYAMQFIPQTPRSIRVYWRFREVDNLSPYESMLATVREIFLGVQIANGKASDST